MQVHWPSFYQRYSESGCRHMKCIVRIQFTQLIRLHYILQGGKKNRRSTRRHDNPKLTNSFHAKKNQLWGRNIGVRSILPRYVGTGGRMTNKEILGERNGTESWGRSKYLPTVYIPGAMSTKSAGTRHH